MKSRDTSSIASPWILAGALVVAWPSMSAALGVVPAGYYKNFTSGYHYDQSIARILGSQDQFVGSFSNRLRIDLNTRPGEGSHIELSYDFLPIVQNEVLFGFDPISLSLDPFTYRAVDLDRLLYPESEGDVDNFAVFQNLDRALYSYRAPGFDVIVGRQAIAWGSARAVNPTDVIAPFAYNDLDVEDRIGVDAARLRVPLSALGELDVGYIFGDDFEFAESAFFLRGVGYLAMTDVILLAMGFRENGLIGIDLARSLGGAGSWLEAAYVLVDLFGDRSGDEDDYFRVSIGLDHSLSSGVYGYLEYHFNGSGRTSASEYSEVLLGPAFTEGADYLLGRHYLAPGVTWQISPLVSGALTTLVNLTDPSALLAPSVEYNIFENAYLDAGSFLALGALPQNVTGTAPSSASFDFGSEFGTYGDIVYLSFRYYF